MFHSWFAEKLAGSTEYGCHPEVAEALRKYLNQETTAKEAARAIARPVENADNLLEELRRLWKFLFDAMFGLPPSTTDTLVELLQAIDDLPEPDMTGIAEENRPVEKVWCGIPGFVRHYEDALDWDETRHEATTTGVSPARGAFCARMAGIAARLANAGVGSWMDYGYETVADALERSDAVFGFEIPLVVEWFKFARPQFEAGALMGEESDALAKPRDLWRGGDAMSLGRLSFWRKRLDEIRMQSQGTMQAAEAALAELISVPTPTPYQGW
ncbi:hypothetical protein F4818DRAFT_445046 [Hypoxylon cercidicola]|nr:hypothetical protein F4818DRAFT_445046 [Hypoxylon cercidicola]